MSYDSYSSGSRSTSADTALGDFLPEMLNQLNLRGLGALGGGLFALYAAQWLAGAVLGAGVTWGSARATMYGQPGLGNGYYDRNYRPNFTLGSTYLHAHAGDVLHVNLDADVRVGEIHVLLSRVPGFATVKTLEVRRSGQSAYDVQIPEAGFYTVMFDTTDARTGAEIRKATGSVVTEDLSYRLDWRLSR